MDASAACGDTRCSKWCTANRAGGEMVVRFERRRVNDDWAVGELCVGIRRSTRKEDTLARGWSQ